MIINNNEVVRNKIKETGITLCELSYRVQIAESTLFRWLRHPLNQEHEELLLGALKDLKAREVKP
jgi:lambda repressor-like predicted transcriptional regulator